MGERWNGTAIIPVYASSTDISNATTPKSIQINLSQVPITWDKGGAPPNVTGSGTLGFTLPTGYTAGYIYQYDLHGHVNAPQATPQFVSTITSTSSAEAPLNSSIPVNWNGTDWWYGNPVSTYPLANVGSMSNSPNTITYNYTNANEVLSVVWNIYIQIGIASGGGGGGGGNNPSDDPYSWWEIIGIVFIVLVIIILFCYLISWFYSGSSTTVSDASTGT